MPQPASALADHPAMPDRIPLARIVSPQSAAVIGASGEAGEFGGRAIHCLVRHGYPGRLLPIGPNRARIRGLPACASVGPVDVAILAMPALRLPQQIEDGTAAGAGRRSLAGPRGGDGAPHRREGSADGGIPWSM